MTQQKQNRTSDINKSKKIERTKACTKLKSSVWYCLNLAFFSLRWASFRKEQKRFFLKKRTQWQQLLPEFELHDQKESEKTI